MTSVLLFPVFVRQGRSRTRFKVGYIDPRGHTVIDPVFDDGTTFYEGRAAVKVKNRWGIISTSGDFLVQPKLWSWCRFHQGLASLATKNGKWGVIDQEGQFVIQPKFDYVGPFNEDLALFCIGELAKARYGYLDKNGNEAIPAVLHDACGFSEGLAAAKVGNLWGYIDSSGAFKITPRFAGTRQGHNRMEETRAGSFLAGLAPACSGESYGFVDLTGKFVIDGGFDEAQSFKEDRALIKRNGRFGFINRKGALLIDCRFTLARDFSEGLARVREKESGVGFSAPSGFINLQGQTVIEPAFSSAESFRDGLSLVTTQDSIAYIDRFGEFVWRAPFVEYGVLL